jgi:cytoskeletal protein RodZ
VFEIGNSLREARLRQQIDFREAEQATKVRSRYLRALEDEQFSTLPAQTYVRGFLRVYADYLGLDGQLYVDEYNSRFVVDEEGLARMRRRSSPSRSHRRFETNVVVIGLAAIVAVTALVIAAWKFSGTSQPAADTPRAAPAARHAKRAARHAARTAAPRRPAQAHLVVSAAHGNSWLEVHADSATGKLLFEGTLEHGKSQRFVARQIWLNIGAPENLTLTLNSRPVTVGSGNPRVLVVNARTIRPASTGT